MEENGSEGSYFSPCLFSPSPGSGEAVTCRGQWSRLVILGHQPRSPGSRKRSHQQKACRLVLLPCPDKAREKTPK